MAPQAGGPGRRSVRAQARQESIRRSTEGRRIMKEARREEALREGRPLPRGWLSRMVDALRGRGG